MKKILLACMVCLLAAAAFAEEVAAQEEKRPWTAFSIGLLPGVPSINDRFDVRGLKLGIPCVDGSGKCYGIEASGAYSGTNTVYGIQAAWWGPSIARYIEGIQASMPFSFCRSFDGFQAGGGCVATEKAIGCQAAIAGVSADFTGFQTGAVNVSYEKFSGLQFGAVNVVCNKPVGAVQVGAFNFITKIKEWSGMQIGVFNFSSHDGIQLGGINIIADGYIPVTIIFNCSFRKTEN